MTDENWACILVIDYADGPPQGRKLLHLGSESECEAVAGRIGEQRDLSEIGKRLEGQTADVIEIPLLEPDRLPLSAMVVVCRESAVTGEVAA